MSEKKKFNIIDVIIVIILILIVAVTVYRAFELSDADKSTKLKDINYSVTVTNIDSIYSDSIDFDDEIYISKAAVKCGSIKDFTAEYMHKTDISTDLLGNTVVLNKLNPSKIKLNLTVNVRAHYNGSLLYLTDNVYLTEGQRIEFYTDTFTFEGIVSDFEEIIAE